MLAAVDRVCESRNIEPDSWSLHETILNDSLIADFSNRGEIKPAGRVP